MTKTRKPPKQPMKLGRLALRKEGIWWNAYWAKHQDSMNEAVLLGSLRLNLSSGDVRDKFIDTMKAAFDNVVRAETGQTPTWSEPEPAPEDERSGTS